MTTSPRPRPPIRPAITTSDSANMIVWLTDSSSWRRASGSCTLKSVWARRGAERARRLHRVAGDAADAERRDAHGRRDRVDHRADHGRRRADREEDHDRHQVGERGHDLHRVEHRRDPAVEALASGRRTRRSGSRPRARAAPPPTSARASGCSPPTGPSARTRRTRRTRSAPAASRRSAARSAREAAIVPTQVSHSSMSLSAVTSHSASARKPSRRAKIDVRVRRPCAGRAASPGRRRARSGSSSQVSDAGQSNSPCSRK